MKGGAVSALSNKPENSGVQAGRPVRNRLSVAGSAFVATLGLMLIAAAPASATSTDLTGGAGATFFSQITSYFKDHVIAAVLALFALTIGVGVLMGWGRKAAKSK